MKEELILTENERKCLRVLHDDTDHWGEHCIYFNWIMDETKLSRKEVQKACRSLREKGLVQFYRGLMTEDGEVAGSGYCISSEGKALINPCDHCKDEAHYDWWEDEKGELTIKSLGVKHFKLCEKHYQENKNAKISYEKTN